MIDDLITPVVVPDIDEGVMSYRAALIGNEPPKLENSNKPVAEVIVMLREGEIFSDKFDTFRIFYRIYHSCETFH